MYDRDFMGSPDFYGADGKPRDFTVSITKVEQGQLQRPGSSEKKRKPVLTFKEAKKRFVCITTNSNIISALYGPFTEGWIGKRVTLYVGQTSFGGVPCDGLRVRPAIPP